MLFLKHFKCENLKTLQDHEVCWPNLHKDSQVGKESSVCARLVFLKKC